MQDVEVIEDAAAAVVALDHARARLLGTIERSGDDHVLVALNGPVPGCVLLACLDERDGTSVSRVAGYLSGPDGPAAVDASASGWTAGSARLPGPDPSG